MKIISWNVNGIRAAIKKDFLTSLSQMGPDILCIQETKAQDDQVKEAVEALNIEEYRLFSNSAVKKGYSGTAILSKEEPLTVTADMGIEEHDQEGRVLCAEYNKFFLITVYTPNSGAELKRLEYRQEWDRAFLVYLKKLEKKKPLVICGDFNVAHKEIDIARPKANYNKSAGFMQEEIDGMDNYQSSGFIDTWRHQHPEDVKYSWWSYRAGARQKNIGWRIDYFLLSPALTDKIVSTDILNDIHGSDHCPVTLELSV